ncbi:hypothetical protein [Pseudophaeobacter sp.]|jgi:hypothetical protein|uniref:hypothetical protein n=1 Tax=Pseudophaeobacter sp. TaxID=1971739 RepID=UPI0032D8BC01
MQITIHIGFPKCASTSLQAYMADNDALFRAAGLLYPESHRLHTGYRHHGPLLAPDLDLAAAVDDIANEAQTHRCGHILLSTEEYTTNRTGRLAALTREFSKRFGPEAVSLLCLLRDPVAMLRSSYQQFVRAGLWGIHRDKFYNETDGSIEAYIEAFHKVRECHWFAYDDLLRAAMTGVTAGRLTVWDLDRISDLAGQLDHHFSLPGGQTALVKNIRVSMAKLHFLRLFQQEFGQKAYRRNRGPLIRKIDLPSQNWTEQMAIDKGLDLPDDVLHQRFPHMQDHKMHALAMDGPLAPCS